MHQSIEAFEKGCFEDDPTIAPSQIYAYAALREGIPFANGAPNLTVDIPALQELSKKTGAPICGKDFKTGQTLIKTVLAPAFKARMLGVARLVLDEHSGQSRWRGAGRSGVVQDQGRVEAGRAGFHPAAGALSGAIRDIYHKVRINYYPPRGDNKEGWDNIDIFGWLGYPMQIKVDFLCRDSILAAPLALDLVLFLDLASAHAGAEASRHPGVAELLLQVTDDGRGALSGA